MSTISKMETPTGQEETAILLEEQARRIATLQESLKQAGRIHPNEAVILQEIKRVVDERDDLRRRLENADILIEHLKREVKELNFSVALHDRAAKKARAIWEEAHPGAEFIPGWMELIVWLTDRVERAEAAKESLTSALRDIKKNVDDWNLQDYVTIRRLVNAALRTAEESSVVDRTPAKQPEGTTKLDKTLQNIDVTKRVLVENSCPSEFGLEDCEFNPESGCTLCCEDCWNEEVTE